MALRDWLKRTERPIKTDFQRVATATIATTATKRPETVRTLATVAKIAVAEPRKGKTDPGRITMIDLNTEEQIFNFLAGSARPCPESEILAAVGGDSTYTRNIIFRLAAEGVVEYLGEGEYQIPSYPPKKPALPEGCPLRTGGNPPKGCGFHPKFLAKMLQSGTLAIGGACPLMRACRRKVCMTNKRLSSW